MKSVGVEFLSMGHLGNYPFLPSSIIIEVSNLVGQRAAKNKDSASFAVSSFDLVLVNET